MINIYIDNFRGFKDTFLKINDVNFFVGENSTGKTSLLSLLSLVLHFSFWMDPSFHNSFLNINLGGYDDIVSIFSKNKKTVKVGLYADDLVVDKLKDNEVISVLLYFSKGDKREAILDRYCLLTKKWELSVKVKEKTYRLFKHKESEINGRKFIEERARTFPANRREFKKISIKIPPERIAVFIDYLGFDRKEKTLKTDGFSFSYFEKMPYWIAPIRFHPEIMYYEKFDSIKYSPQGEHTPFLLERLNKVKKFYDLLNKFGKRSSLFDRVNINKFSNKSGSPFKVDILLNNKAVNMPFVGYGVSQVLPIVAEVLNCDSRAYFIIQQPEIHLHPKAQAYFGEFVFDEMVKGKRFIVETHSDFVVDRFRNCLRDSKQKKGLKNKTSQVVFFERKKDGNNLYPISIDNKGMFDKDQPESFRSFFIKEEIRSLGF